MGCFSSKQPIDFDGEVAFNHFKLLRSVGRGAFGKVCIVMKRDDKRLYAMKYMSKQKCIQKKAVNNVFNEQKILEMLEHTFIVNLWFAFQDSEDMFMVVDLMLGGDFRFHLSREGHFSEERVKLYMAELGCCLNYLHGMRVMHRDIKPDNILMDENGHAHIADFNVSCIVADGETLWHRAGTKPYMAPEILSKTGYSFPADWWSLGITMYEMLRGRHPFKGSEPDELVNLIRTGVIKYGQHSDACLSLMEGLLERDVSKRIGDGEEGWKKYREHEFFKDLDWDLVANKEVTPVFIPDKDKVNCDAMYELEEMMLEDNPLYKKKQRQNRSNGDLDLTLDANLRKELQKLKSNFVSYNRIRAREEGGRPRAATLKSSDAPTISYNNSSDTLARSSDVSKITEMSAQHRESLEGQQSIASAAGQEKDIKEEEEIKEEGEGEGGVEEAASKDDDKKTASKDDNEKDEKTASKEEASPPAPAAPAAPATPATPAKEEKGENKPSSAGGDDTPRTKKKKKEKKAKAEPAESKGSFFSRYGGGSEMTMSSECSAGAEV